MRWWALSAILLTAAGCQRDKPIGNTDSASHWMTGCAGNAECGVLACICGVCTTPCATEVCGELGGECSVAPLCESAEPLCVRPEDQPPIMDMQPGDAAVLDMQLPDAAPDATVDATTPDAAVPDMLLPDMMPPPVGECGNPDSECQVDGACDGNPCSALFPAGPCVCVAPVMPRVVECADGCCSTAECGGTDRCQGVGLDAQDALCGQAIEPADNACMPEVCDHDVDCGIGQTCIRPGEWGHVRAACVAALCTQDADCDARPGGQCLGFFTPCVNRGFACAYPDDPCRVDDDCDDRGGPRACVPVEGGGTECLPIP